MVIVCQGDMGTCNCCLYRGHADGLYTSKARFGLLIGIARGMPEQNDIRLPDVVISQADVRSGGVVAHDRGKVTLAWSEPRPLLSDVLEVLDIVFVGSNL